MLHVILPLGEPYVQVEGSKLKQIGPRFKAGRHNWYAVYECECGRFTCVLWKRCGTEISSCGCARNYRNVGPRYGGGKRHGMSRRPEYRIWAKIIQRCTNPNDAKFDNYGGRGITVCERWLKFENFFADMGPRTNEKHSIDRIDNNGNYCPENCRWATVRMQANNKSNNRRLAVDGVTRTLAEWSREAGICPDTIRNRLRKGVPIRDAIFG